MKIFKVFLQIYSCFVLFWSFVIFLLPLSILALPLNANHRIRLVSPGWGLFAKSIMYLGVFAKITKIDQRDEIAKKHRQPHGLHIANHQSFMDIPLMLTSFQIPPIMKKEVLYMPIFGLCAYASGALIVDRSSRESRKKVFSLCQRRLKEEFRSLQYYPEGTRQRSVDYPKELKEIKTPLMKYAYNEGILLYPTSLYGTNKILSNKTGMIRYGQKLGIKHFPALDPKDFETQEEFVETAWSQVTEGYYELAQKLNGKVKMREQLLT